MSSPKKSNQGLIVAIVAGALVLCGGGIAVFAVGVPAYINYIERAKTTEVGANLADLYMGAATYYGREHWNSGAVGPGSPVATQCLVGSAVASNVPSPDKTILDWANEDAAFEALNFDTFGPVYYRYEIVSAGAGCGHTGPGPVYTFRAIGDLDGDGVTSLFELAVGIDETGTMYRAPHVYVENELE